MLNTSHVRYATNRQLAELLRVNENTVSRWTHGTQSPSAALLAQSIISSDVLLEGIRLRREDFIAAKKLRDQIDALLAQEVSDAA